MSGLTGMRAYLAGLVLAIASHETDNPDMEMVLSRRDQLLGVLSSEPSGFTRADVELLRGIYEGPPFKLMSEIEDEMAKLQWLSERIESYLPQDDE